MTKREKPRTAISDSQGTYIPMGKFSIKLGKTYWEKGFMNPGVGVVGLLGGHDEEIKIEFGRGGESIIARISGTANKSGSQRIYTKRLAAIWWQKHFQEGDIVQAHILNPHHILLLLPKEAERAL